MSCNQHVWIKAELLESRPEEILTVELPRLDDQEKRLLAEKRGLQFKQGDIRGGIERRSNKVADIQSTLQSGRVSFMKTELEAQLAGAEAELKAYRKTREPELQDLEEQIKQVSRAIDEVYAQKDLLRNELKLYVRVV